MWCGWKLSPLKIMRGEGASYALHGRDKWARSAGEDRSVLKQRCLLATCLYIFAFIRSVLAHFAQSASHIDYVPFIPEQHAQWWVPNQAFRARASQKRPHMQQRPSEKGALGLCMSATAPVCVKAQRGSPGLEGWLGATHQRSGFILRSSLVQLRQQVYLA